MFPSSYATRQTICFSPIVWFISAVRFNSVTRFNRTIRVDRYIAMRPYVSLKDVSMKLCGPIMLCHSDAMSFCEVIRAYQAAPASRATLFRSSTFQPSCFLIKLYVLVKLYVLAKPGFNQVVRFRQCTSQVPILEGVEEASEPFQNAHFE